MRICFLAAALLFPLPPASAAGAPVFHDEDTAVLGDKLYAVSDRTLAVRLSNLVLETPESLSVSNIIVTGPGGSAARPESFSLWTKPERYSLRKKLNVKRTLIFLFLKEPLKDGGVYSVRIDFPEFIKLSPETGLPDGGVKTSPPELSFKYEGDLTVSGSISVNQAGYLPGGPKFAYLGQYMGAKNGVKDSAAELDVRQFKEFKIINAETGAAEFSGKTALSAACAKNGGRDPLSGCAMLEMDFSAFQKPGSYRVLVPGAGVSYPFVIDSAVYNQVFGVLMRGLYHQRCGEALSPEFTRHTHPACHLNDARIPDIDEYKKKNVSFYPQTPGQINCPGGHHDAGDYGKYVVNTSLAIHYILGAFEIAPERLSYDNSPIPEAGDGIPDLLQEAKRAVDWISKMQASDGAVFSAVKPEPVMSYEKDVAGKSDKQRVVWWKSPRSTAAFAAALAGAARSAEFRKFYPDAADAYLKQARKAWDFCASILKPDGQPPDFFSGEPYADSVAELYCRAATELWLATGEQKYHDYFLANHKPESGRRWTWWPLYRQSGAATRAYFYGTRDGKDPEMRKKCAAEANWAAEKVLSWRDNYTNRCCFSAPAFRYNDWGWIFLSHMAGYDLSLYARVCGDFSLTKEMIDAALFNADQEIGNNPAGLSYITGIGKKRPVDHVHQLSRYDDIIEPVPGISLGFHPASYNRGKSDRALMASYSAGGLPVAYRYADCWFIPQETTIAELFATAVTYATLGNPKAQKSGKPSLKISANGSEHDISGPAPLKVSFAAEASGANGKKIREYHWDLDNEEFSCARDFDYTFKEPGVYNVCCTVTDDSGWINYKYIRVTAAGAK